jgi:glycosyltransferase involved in cell wall biosynthesis
LLGIALFCAWLPWRKSVLTFHSGGFCLSPEGQAITPSGLPAWVFRRLDAIVAVNAQIRDFFVKQCGVAEKRVHLISPHATVRAEAELSPPLKRFFDAHEPLLLCVCGLEPEYDVPIQIETLSHVLKKFPNAGLAILGSGSQKQTIATLIAGKPYADHILLAGDTPHAATLRAIQECSMLLRTTHYDGDALSVREAIDLGTPVIATDNGMRPEGCHLIPMPPQLEPLVAQIERVLTTPVKKATAPPEGEAGVENLDQVIALYESLLR